MLDFEARIRADESGARHALVMDGEDAHRASVVALLSQRGFAVTEAADAHTALTVIGEAAPALALLQSGEAGDRAAALATMLYPHTRIILTVASTDAVTGAGDADSPLPVLTRPVDPGALDRCLTGMGLATA